MADRDAGLVSDQLAQLQKILVAPFLTVSPAGFFLEQLFYLPDQAFVGWHNCKITCLGPPGRMCTNLYQHVSVKIRFFPVANPTLYEQFNTFMLRLLLLLCLCGVLVAGP